MNKVSTSVLVVLATIGLVGCPPVVKEIRFVEYQPWKVMSVEVLRPSVPPEGKMPLIIVSHGIGGSPRAFSELMESRVKTGHLVLAPQHQDYVNIDGIDGPLTIDWVNFIDDMLQLLPIVEQFGFEHYNIVDLWFLLFYQAQTGEMDNETINSIIKEILKYRLTQLKSVINLAQRLNNEKGGLLYNKIDLDNITLIGHSLGGLTISQFVVPTSEYYDARVKNAVFISPATALYDLSEVMIPTMWIGGTNDEDWAQKTVRQGFDQVSGPAEFVKINGADHNSYFGKDMAVTNAGIVDWLDYWMYDIGISDNFLSTYSDSVSEFEVKNWFLLETS